MLKSISYGQNDSTKYNDQVLNLLFIENIPRTYPILHNAKKIKFSIEENLLQETAELVTFIGDILNRKLHFLCSDIPLSWKEKFQNILLIVFMFRTTIPKNTFQKCCYQNG